MRGSIDKSVTAVAVIISVLVVWVFTVSVTVPQLWPGNFDYGFFTAVAERLRAGDTLYEQVWDNKDPFIFYSIAIARTFGPLGAWLLELLWVAATSLAVLAIARRVHLGWWNSVFVAFAATPVAVLGVPYFMGSSHLPGIALSLAALALVMHKRFWLAGIPIALLVFFKFVMLPLAFAVVIAWAVVNKDQRLVLRTAGSCALTTAVIAVVLAIRGELVGFITTQIDNILYSQSPIVDAAYTGLFQKVAQHIVILVNPNVLAVEITTVVVLAITWFVLRRSNSSRETSSVNNLRALWWTAVVAFVVSGGIIAATGKWLHHAEVFVVSSALVLVLVVVLLARVKSPGIVLVLVTLVVAYLLAGRPAPSWYADQVRDVGSKWANAQQVDELTAILLPLEASSVAFVGRGNLLPRSPGLQEWTLTCRHMAQRPFNPPSMFTETLECLPGAQRIVVTRDYERDTAFPAYAQFYDAVEALLAQDYSCQEANGFRVCERRLP